MKKKKFLKIGLRVLGYAVVIGIAVGALVAASGGTDEGSSEIKTPIRFEAGTAEEGMQAVAENNRFVLYADLASAIVSLHDKTTGETISSAPEGVSDREDIKNAAKMELSSLLNIKYADRDSNVTSQNSTAGCVNKGTVCAKRIANGVRFELYFKTEGFLIPIELTLTERGMTAVVPLADIQEASSSVKLTTVSVLPNFGAGEAAADGYVLVPDGSGALIPFDSSGENYSQRVYGSDLAVAANTSSGNTAQTVRLPVFGEASAANGFLGIITSGDTRANINANVASAKKPYTSAYTEFIYRETMLVNISQQTFESTQANMFEPEHCRLEMFAVEYRPLSEKTYTAMANEYRDYLMNEQGMQVRNDTAPALQLQLIGGVMHNENILGIPVSRVLPVTAYGDVVTLTERLQAEGVDSLCVNYLYWGKDGTLERLTLDDKTEGRLGGRTAFEDMVSTLQSANVRLHLNLNFTHFQKNQGGFSCRYDAAQTVRREPLMAYRYRLTTYQRDESADAVFLLAPSQVVEAVRRWSSRQPSDGVGYGYSLGRLANLMYSDFGSEPNDRGAVKALWSEAVAQIKGVSGELLADSANAYVFPYVDVIQETPVEHSGFLCESEAVPFYQIALHGLAEMSVPSVNASDSPQQRMLKALESGIELTYTVGYRNTAGFQNTAASSYAYIDFETWRPDMVRRYADLERYLALVGSQAVTEHTKLADRVYRTVFANGVGVVVNFGDTAVTVDGAVIEAEGYLPIGW